MPTAPPRGPPVWPSTSFVRRTHTDVDFVVAERVDQRLDGAARVFCSPLEQAGLERRLNQRPLGFLARTRFEVLVAIGQGSGLSRMNVGLVVVEGRVQHFGCGQLDAGGAP